MCFSDSLVSRLLLSVFQFDKLLQINRGFMGGFPHTFLSINNSYHQAPFSSSCFSSIQMLFQTKQSRSTHYFQMFRLWSAQFGNISGNENVINAQPTANLQAESRPNQSLKLTGPAVDDLAARYWTDLATADRHVRATNYLAAAVRRRSLAPVR